MPHQYQQLHVTWHKGVTRLLLIILPTMSEPTLSINCLLLGSDSSEVFTVKIPKTENVSILKRLIKEEQSHSLNHVDASKLTVWKVSLPVDTIAPELTVDGVKASKQLRSVEKMSSIFGEDEVEEHVHILVQAPPGALHKRLLDLND
jgi:Crinkler effector protein N-terminal domain